MLYVKDIFYSIQGESSFAGYSCKFIRLAGCNLKCSYCDTNDALNMAKSKKLSINEIIGTLNNMGGKINLVEITGGEPLLQDEVYCLFSALIKFKYSLLLETNGTINLSDVPKKVIKVVDVKCPSSGFSGKFKYDNLKYIEKSDELKFVIGTKEDYDFAKDFLKKNKIKTNKIIFSPIEDVMSSKELALKILKDELNVRIGLQLHKILHLK